LLEILAKRREAVVSVRGFAHITFADGKRSVGSRHAVVARRPDHFRLEVLAPFGALAVVATDGHDLALYASRENRIYRGPATPESVAAYTAVPIAVPDVVAILLGTPPVRHPEGGAVVARQEDAALIRLTIPLAAGRQVVWFAPDTLWPVASETALPDGGTLRVSFGDYRRAGGLAFPYAIDVRAEPGDGAVRVRYASPALNADPADGLFSLPRRAGVDEFMIEQRPGGGAPS
jgi:outer membrane lipoprotein-sorting protein